MIRPAFDRVGIKLFGGVASDAAVRLARTASRPRAGGRDRGHRGAPRRGGRCAGAVARSRRDPPQRAARQARRRRRRDGLPSARPAHRARARSGVLLHVSAPARSLALGGRGDPAVLAAGRRSAGRERRCGLAARRLSRAACRRARRRLALPRRAAAGGGAIGRDPRRVRRLHGAGAGARGRRWPAPCDGRAAAARDLVRPAPAAHRLPPCPPARRLRAGIGRERNHGSRVSLRPHAVDRRRAAGRLPRRRPARSSRKRARAAAR